MKQALCWGKAMLPGLQRIAADATAQPTAWQRKFDNARGTRAALARTAIMACMAASLLLATAWHGLASAGEAQSFPSKPVRIIAASGGSDLVSRLLATQLNKEWGQGVVVDTRSGASGLITLDLLAQSVPDGYNLAVVTLSQMLSTLENQRRLLATEFAPVSFVGSTPFVIAINASLPANSLDEWITYARSQPGKLRYASAGMFVSSHVCMEEFNTRAGLNLLHVPYKASTAGMSALLSGEVHALCGAAANAVSLAKAGKIRLLGTTYKEPSDLVPGVPPLANRLPGFEVLGWYAVIAPAGTPRNVTAKISADIAKLIKAPEMQQVFQNVGIRPDGSSPEQLAAFLKAEGERWGKMMRTMKISQ